MVFLWKIDSKLLWHRMQNFSIRQFIEIILPLKIDDLLYISDESRKVFANDLPYSASIKRFSIEKRSGVDRIDRRLTPYNLAYVVSNSDETVHESWVSFDALLPSQYGFDSRLPVIGHSFTAPRYRGKGIYPFTLRYIINDLRNRNISCNAYILVSSANKTSIRGIERAGFQRLAQLKGTRMLGCFILNKSTIRFEECKTLRN
jgi:hypothetical protein